MRTEFRLVVVSAAGWEYTVIRRDLGAIHATVGGGPGAARNLMVTCIEFESAPVLLGHLGVRVSMIAYPIVSVSKVGCRGRGRGRVWGSAMSVPCTPKARQLKRGGAWCRAKSWRSGRQAEPRSGTRLCGHHCYMCG